MEKNKKRKDSSIPDGENLSFRFLKKSVNTGNVRSLLMRAGTCEVLHS